MPVQNKPIIHARDHEEGGADPIRLPSPAIPGNYSEMALAWSDAYWKLEETELGEYFLDELPGHHDLEPVTESGLTRGILHGPDEPDSVGAGFSNPYLYLGALDERIGVADDCRVAFFAVVTLEPPPFYAFLSVAGCYVAGEVTPDVGMRWQLGFVEVEELGEFAGYQLRGEVFGPGGYGVAAGTTLIGPVLGGYPFGVAFDVGFNYNGAQIELYLNGLLEGSESAPEAWTNEDREGVFHLGAMDRTGEATGDWHPFEGSIGSAMLSVDSSFTSGQFHDLHTGTPSSTIIEGFPAGSVTPEKIEPGTEGYVLKTTGGVTSWERQTVQVNY